MPVPAGCAAAAELHACVTTGFNLLNLLVTVPNESVVDLYAGLHGTSQGDQITEAAKLVKETGRVARAFAEERRRLPRDCSLRANGLANRVSAMFVSGPDCRIRGNRLFTRARSVGAPSTPNRRRGAAARSPPGSPLGGGPTALWAGGAGGGNVSGRAWPLGSLGGKHHGSNTPTPGPSLRPSRVPPARAEGQLGLARRSLRARDRDGHPAGRGRVAAPADMRALSRRLQADGLPPMRHPAGLRPAHVLLRRSQDVQERRRRSLQALDHLFEVQASELPYDPLGFVISWRGSWRRRLRGWGGRGCGWYPVEIVHRHPKRSGDSLSTAVTGLVATRGPTAHGVLGDPEHCRELLVLDAPLVKCGAQALREVRC